VKNEDVTYVAVSHIHIDHAGGAGTLLRHLPNAKLIVHSKGASHLIDPRKLWGQTKQVLGSLAEMYGAIDPVPEERIIAAADGTVIDLGDDAALEILEMPGHASHELGFFARSGGGIFPGDAAGVYLSPLDVIIPTTPPPFNLEMTLISLERLVSMDPQWLYYSHFGPTSKATEKLETYIGQLNLWAAIILEGMKEGKDMATIYERILEKDSATRLAADFIQKHLILRRGVIMQDIQGFVDYFRKTL
jgi:glyoxylase-like metal-dependent hydrolase (beta-lactamase superfamily II)